MSRSIRRRPSLPAGGRRTSRGRAGLSSGSSTMNSRIGSVLACVCLLSLARSSFPAPAAAPPASDPLAAEMARWSAFPNDTSSTEDLWKDVKGATAPVMERAEKALHDGRRLLALNRFAAGRMYLAAFDYLQHRPPEERKDAAGFEAEWTRFGKQMRKDLGTPRA